jgi:hypothetical protein
MNCMMPMMFRRPEAPAPGARLKFHSPVGAWDVYAYREEQMARVVHQGHQTPVVMVPVTTGGYFEFTARFFDSHEAGEVVALYAPVDADPSEVLEVASNLFGNVSPLS